MDYALAHELKDAGFPQEGNGRWLFDPNAIVARAQDRVYAPTLEELIEACGKRFLMLLKHDDKSGWTAVKEGDVLFIDGKPNPSLSIGLTPAEAVARLGLCSPSLRQERARTSDVKWLWTLPPPSYGRIFGHATTVDKSSAESCLIAVSGDQVQRRSNLGRCQFLITNDTLVIRATVTIRRHDGEEGADYPSMDCNRCQDSKGTGETEGWCSKDIEVVKADGWCRNYDGFEEGNLA